MRFVIHADNAGMPRFIDLHADSDEDKDVLRLFAGQWLVCQSEQDAVDGHVQLAKMIGVGGYCVAEGQGDA